MMRTNLVIDGLTDPHLAQDLSARWFSAGYANAVDIAGQSAWLAHRPQPTSEREDPDTKALTETDLDRAAAIARAYGLIIRDRIGATFRADLDLTALRRQIIDEYKSRFATALVFGLPALGLHYFAHHLAGGSGEARAMVLPRLFEMLLIGWACIAAAWPILCQGIISAVHLRATADLLTTLIVIASFIPSTIGLGATVWAETPPFSPPMYHAALAAVFIAVYQRWIMHAHAVRTSGKAMMMIPHLSRIICACVTIIFIIMLFDRWEVALAFGLIFPPMIGLGAINRWSPGTTMLLPVIAFAVVFVIAPRALSLGNMAGIEIEIAFGFNIMMTITMQLSWSKLSSPTPPRN